MTKRSLGLAVLLGLPVVAGGAFAIHSLASKPAPTAVAEQANPDADVPPDHARKKKHHHRHHAGSKRAERAGAGQTRKQAVDSSFQRWLVSPRGDALGILLADDTIVKLPKGAAAQASLKPGDALHVEGRSHQVDQAKVIAHATVSKEGKVLFAENGKADQRAERDQGARLQPMTATGKVIAVIPARKGALLGVVLDDGTTVIFGHGTAGSDVVVKVGDSVTVEGRGGTYPIGTGIAAQSIKLPSGETKTFGRGGNKKNNNRDNGN
jgi:hypothetical protein